MPGPIQHRRSYETTNGGRCGEVVWFSSEKRHGFIRPFGGWKWGVLLFKWSNVVGMLELEKGDVVEFEIKERPFKMNQRNFEAVSVVRIGGA